MPSFSSYIKSEQFKKLQFNNTTYSYKFGDISYHYLNSIHYSNGNTTSEDSFFVVFRFQTPKASIDIKAQTKYDLCYAKHQERLNNKN